MVRPAGWSGSSTAPSVPVIVTECAFGDADVVGDSRATRGAKLCGMQKEEGQRRRGGGGKVPEPRVRCRSAGVARR
jgi:hypothetical protein